MSDDLWNFRPCTKDQFDRAASREGVERVRLSCGETLFEGEAGDRRVIGRHWTIDPLRPIACDDYDLRPEFH